MEHGNERRSEMIKIVDFLKFKEIIFLMVVTRIKKDLLEW